MKVLIIGGAGMIGRKLTDQLCASGRIGGDTISAVTTVDISAPAAVAGSPFPVYSKSCDIAEPDSLRPLISDRPDIVFHLAAVVSGEAEADFDEGYRVNVDGTRQLFDMIRTAGEAYCPRVVFASSIAVFGAPFPDPIPDDFHSTPLTSYGAQKRIAELLLADMSRLGMMDGIGIRLPTVVVRPGKPNLAASGFFSGIIREPLNGMEAVLPVSDDVMHWMASPRAAIGFLIHAAGVNTSDLGAGRSMTMPGLAVTVAEQIDALRRIGGEKCVSLIRRKPDETIRRIVSGWPRAFDTARATALGFTADNSFDAIVRAYIEDEEVNI